MMFQSYALFPHLNGVDNVAFSLKMRGVPRRERRAAAIEMLRLVDMAHFSPRLPPPPFRGQHHRVALARAPLTPPPIPLLDPTPPPLPPLPRLKMRPPLPPPAN